MRRRITTSKMDTMLENLGVTKRGTMRRREFLEEKDLRRRVNRLNEKLHMDEKDWIQKVDKESEKKGTKGVFHDWCIDNGFEDANMSCIKKAKKVARDKGDTTLLKRAVAAENMLTAQKDRR